MVTQEDINNDDVQTEEQSMVDDFWYWSLKLFYGVVVSVSVTNYTGATQVDCGCFKTAFGG